MSPDVEQPHDETHEAPGALDPDRPRPERSASGRLSPTSRAAAVAAAMDEVVSYFASGKSTGLAERPAADTEPADLARPRGEPDAGTVAAALRLRVALSASARLADIGRRLGAAPNFRYERVRDEVAGQIRGRLDVPRYIRTRGRLSAPRTYPVVVVQRDNATAENVLAAYAVRWTLHELETATAATRPPPDSAEGREARTLRASLLRLLGVPHVADARQSAERVLRRGSVAALLERVEARIAAGHVARPEGYAELASWIRATLSGSPVARPGEVATALQDDAFDPRLFELWCLVAFTRALTGVLGAPVREDKSFLDGGGEPRAVFITGSTRVEVMFQSSLADLTGEPAVYRYVPSQRPFRGFPDIAARVTTTRGSTLVLVDAKLRQRDRAPHEELYKMLGYFANAKTGSEPQRLGAIVFHDPAGHAGGERPRRYTIRADASVVEAVLVDPADETGSAAAFAHLASLVIRAAGHGDAADGLRDQLRALHAVDADDPDELALDLACGGEQERRHAAAQALSVEQFARQAELAPPEALETTNGHLRATVGSDWDKVGPRVGRMLVSASHFGVSAPSGADLSGPVLGLCAGVERLLHETWVDPALATAGLAAGNWTLGRLLHHLTQATEATVPLKPAAAAVREALRAGAEAAGIDVDQFASLVPRLQDMRVRYRNRAAHEGLLDAAVWYDAYAAVLLGDTGLVPSLLRLPTSPGTTNDERVVLTTTVA